MRADAERMLALGRQAKLTGKDADAWAERLGPERDSLRWAIEWLAANGDAEAALELAAAVWRLWLRAGAIAEGRTLLAAALDPPGAEGEKTLRIECQDRKSTRLDSSH